MNAIDRLKDMIRWSSKKGEPCDRGIIKGTFCRNWRTWMGHSDVADVAMAVGLLPLVFTTATWAVVFGLACWLSGIGFYAWKEFGKGGNFYDQTEEDIRDRNDKKTDSVLDFMVPTFTSTFLKFSFSPIVAIVIVELQTSVAYLVYRGEAG